MEELKGRLRRLAILLLDVLALAVVGLVVYRLFIAPRVFAAPPARPLPLVFSMLDGSTYHLSSRRGRVVFVEFSTSWCEACKASLPFVERYARLHRDVDVVTVDSGEAAPVAAHFAAENGLRPHFLALDTGDQITDALGVSGYPTILVIDRRGRLRAQWYGFNPAVEAAMEHARVRL